MKSSSSSPDRNIGREDFFMRKALQVAEDALEQGEVPVGCVIVLRETLESTLDTDSTNRSTNDVYDYDNSPEVIVSHGANQVNATRDATRHAECIAIDRMLTGGMMSDQSRLPQHVIAKAAHGKVPNGLKCEEFRDEWVNLEDKESHDHWKNKYGWRSGRLFQKEIFQKCDLYVTCEPCIMCAAALARVRIGRVFYGCKNGRFGGNGSLLSLHQESALPSKEHVGYPIVPGVLEENAVNLLRSFYDRENFHAPDDKRKRKPQVEASNDNEITKDSSNIN